MKRHPYLRCAGHLTIGLPLATGLAHADVTGRVVAVQDGDTLTVRDRDRRQHRIRLAGIDAPEKNQAFGHRSKEGLSDCAYSREVTVKGSKVDRYGRVVGKVTREGVDCKPPMRT